MRRSAALAIVCSVWALAGPASGGPIRLGVETGTRLEEPFLVRITGHYADFHNGHSRHWKTALIPAGGRHFVALGPVNAVLNMGVSVSVYHPAYISERERSRKTPLLIRPVGFETFQPRSWHSVMASGGAFENGGPEQFLGQAFGHVREFVESYLPAVDRSDRWEVPDSALRRHLPLFREIDRFCDREEARLRRSGGFRGDDPAFERALARQDLEMRAELSEWVRRSEAWLSLARAERVEVHRRLEQMSSARSVAEELLTGSDVAEIAAFVERQLADRAEGREPEGAVSWTNPATRISFRAKLRGRPGDCVAVSVTTDLTTLVAADLGDLTHSVRGRLCRGGTGSWEYSAS
jgi:hypothetical protein